jgi:hypothetical protein
MYMRKKSVPIALVILEIGLVGTGLSTLYKKNELTVNPLTYKAFYGFPLSWYGYSEQIVSLDGTMVYWYSAEFFLIDTAFWFAISFFVSFAAIKSANILRRTRTSKNLSVFNI